MKKIKDERLIMRNLKNIRIAFIVENVAIIFTMIYQVLSGQAFYEVFSRDNLLFIVLMIGCFTLTFLSMNISIQIEGKEKRSKKAIYFFSSAVFGVVTLINYLLPGGTNLPVAILSRIIMGGITFGILKYINKYRI